MSAEHVDRVSVRAGDIMVTASSRARLTYRNGVAVAAGAVVDIVLSSAGDTVAVGGRARCIARVLPVYGAGRIRAIVDGD